MDLDILNEIMTFTVGDLFKAPSKYNILAPIQRYQTGLGGVKNLVLKQQQQQILQPQPLLQQNSLQNVKQGQQTFEKPSQVVKPSIQQEKISYLEPKKSVTSSLNSSLASALLDQSSSSQLNYSKEISSQRGQSLNSSFQYGANNEQQSQLGVFRDSTNVIRSSSQYQPAPQFQQSQIVTQQQPILQQQQGIRQQSQQGQQSFSQNSSIASNNLQLNSQQQRQSGIQQQQHGYFQQVQPNQQQIVQQVPKSFLNNFVNETNPQLSKLSSPQAEEEWINIEGPKRLEESLKKLNLDQQKITMRLIKEMGIEQLKTEKKKVKNELKLYDQAFENTFHKPPTRNQKEPLRPLYVYYKGLNQAISKHQVNNENIRPTVGTGQPKMQLNNNNNNNNNNLTGFNKITSEPASIQSSITQATSSQQVSQNDSFDVQGSKYSKQPQQQGFQYLQLQQPNYQLQSLQQQQQQQQFAQQKINTQQQRGVNVDVRKLSGDQRSMSLIKGDEFKEEINQINVIPSQSQAMVIESKIVAMKKKRSILQEQLQAYQDDFYRTHNRKIKYHKDILPVEQEYKQYKDIKKEIIRLEQILQPNTIISSSNNNNHLIHNNIEF